MYLHDAVPFDRPRGLVSAYALWGGMPRYWELAEPFGTDLDTAVDSLVLDPSGPLHGEPDRLLLEEKPSGRRPNPFRRSAGNRRRWTSPVRRAPRSCTCLFVPDAREVEAGPGVVTVDAETVMAVLR